MCDSVVDALGEEEEMGNYGGKPGRGSGERGCKVRGKEGGGSEGDGGRGGGSEGEGGRGRRK